jgi:hypothetical protein
LNGLNSQYGKGAKRKKLIRRKHKAKDLREKRGKMKIMECP